MNNQDNNQTGQAAKQRYSSPELLEIGDLAELTLVGGTNGADGGVSP